MQELETREVPATLLNLSQGVLTITAAAGGSMVTVSPTSTPGQVNVSWYDMSDHASATVPEVGVTAIVFNGSSTGVNEYTNNTTISETLNGSGTAEDIVYSGYGASTVNASNGINVVVSRAQSSTVNLGTGFAEVLNYGGAMTVTNDPPGDYIYNP
jgi:hypothetical protein